MKNLRFHIVAITMAVTLAAVIMHYGEKNKGYEQRVFSLSRMLMDTMVSITVPDIPEPEEAINRAFAEIERVDKLMARKEGTPLWTLNRNGGGKLDPDLAAVVVKALEWADRSQGSFSPATARLNDLWGFKEAAHAPPDGSAISEVLAQSDWKEMTLEGDHLTLGVTALDLGGIAKGYAVDLAAASLVNQGVSDFIVDAGGDLFVSGSKIGVPWRVGIRDPVDGSKLMMIVSPQEGALVTSGDYERYFDWEGVRYHHILNPDTGMPARGVTSVTVWATTATDADAAATAAFVKGVADGVSFLEELENTEGMIVGSDGVVTKTTGFDIYVPEARKKQ